MAAPINVRGEILAFLDWLIIRDEQSPYGGDGIPELEAVLYCGNDQRQMYLEKLVDLHLAEREKRIKSILQP